MRALSSWHDAGYLAVAILAAAVSTGCGSGARPAPDAGDSGTGGTSGGQVTCRGIDISGGSTGCSFSLADCSDRHAYRVVCVKGTNPYTCSCEVDGVSVSTFSSASTPFCGYTSNVDARPAAVQACGWTMLQ